MIVREYFKRENLEATKIIATSLAIGIPLGIGEYELSRYLSSGDPLLGAVVLGVELLGNYVALRFIPPIIRRRRAASRQ